MTGTEAGEPSLEKLFARQEAWLRSRGVRVERRCVPRIEDNLYAPLSPAARAAFSRGRGGELSGGRRPARMQAVLSSSALAANVFDYWTQVDAAPLQSALGIGPAVAGIRFEVPFPTGLPGTPPHLDVVLDLDGGGIVGIESKFTEWLSRRPHGRAAFSESYFPDGRGWWSRCGLHACEDLARAVASGEEEFLHLDAPQLLKHALGLARAAGRGFQLWYIFYDFGGEAGQRHRTEVERFSAFTGGETGFRAVTYQSLFGGLAAASLAGASAYVSYLAGRYFAGAEDSTAAGQGPQQ